MAEISVEEWIEVRHLIKKMDIKILKMHDSLFWDNFIQFNNAKIQLRHELKNIQ